MDDTGEVALTFVPFARRRYEILTVDVTGQDPRAAIEAALPPETVRDLYRILLTGETGEGGVQAEALQEALADRFYALEIRDQTRLAEDLWARAAEDSLRGLFLRDLKSRLDSARHRGGAAAHHHGRPVWSGRAGSPGSWLKREIP